MQDLRVPPIVNLPSSKRFEQLFLKRLDDRENAAARQAKRKGTTYQLSVKREMRWGYWTQVKAEEALSHLKNVVFPGLVELADVKSSFGEYMKGRSVRSIRRGCLSHC